MARGQTSDGVSGAQVVSGVLRIYGPANGSAPDVDNLPTVASNDDIPVSAGFSGTGGPATVGTFTGAALAATWTQQVTLDTFDTIGDIAVVKLSNGSYVAHTAASAVEATNVSAFATALVAAINLGGGATVSSGIVGNVITLTATAPVVNPTLSVDPGAGENEIYRPIPVVANPVTAGIPADA